MVALAEKERERESERERLRLRVEDIQFEQLLDSKCRYHSTLALQARNSPVNNTLYIYNPCIYVLPKYYT